MRGPVALLGADEFLPAVAALDAELLAATGRRRPRVAIVPTASAGDGETVFRRWAAMGVEHFEALGAEVEAVLIRDRSEADDPACVQASCCASATRACSSSRRTEGPRTVGGAPAER